MFSNLRLRFLCLSFVFFFFHVMAESRCHTNHFMLPGLFCCSLGSSKEEDVSSALKRIRSDWTVELLTVAFPCGCCAS